MYRRNMRIHQMLKNVGVIDSSGEESDETDSNVIENTPAASPGYKTEAANAHTGVKTAQLPMLEDESIKATASSPLTHKATYELGETSIEAPPFSPHTPFMRQIAEKNMPSVSSPYVSSPLRSMSPGTLEVFNILTETQLDSDDSVQDPIYEESNDSSDNSSDENITYKISKRKNRVKRQRAHNPSPSIISILESALGNTEERNEESVLLPVQSRENVNEANNNNIDEKNEAEDTISLPVGNIDEEKEDGSILLLVEDRENIDDGTEDEGSILMPVENRENESPEENSSSNINNPKKRKVRDPSRWKINQEKSKRLKGELYTTRKGKIMQARPIKSAKCASISKHNCILQVSQEEREKIYNEFRNLPNLQEQRHFIVNHVTKKKKNRDTTKGLSRRHFTLVYELTVDEEKKIVCREFFLDTLNITGGFVKGALKKLNQQGLLEPDNRGKKPPPNKLTQAQETFIRDHILSFPAVESHYCRRDSTMKYLDSTLNITIMYNEYKKTCEAKAMNVVSFEKYRSIFREYKLSFHKPKKDLCKQCLAYKEMNDEEKANKSEYHTHHLLRRDAARKCRDEDKYDAQNDDTILSFNFDLEAVLSTPKGASGPFFYVRKLAVYNFTIYNLGNQNVECYMWDETEGKRGTIEISTCINTYISAHNNIKTVRMMSDGCGGQQKNYHFSSMCLITVKKHPTLDMIDHKFFESGHTHMECDSIHSKIESKSKNIPVYTPDGWAQIVRLARTNPRPFNVTCLLHDDFKEFGLQNQYQAKVSNEGRKIGINDAVWLQYRKEFPDTIFLKDNYDKMEPFVALELKKKRGKVQSYPVPAYKERFKVSSMKKRDLLKLCNDMQIPRTYHNFYTNLPCSDIIRRLAP